MILKTYRSRLVVFIVALLSLLVTTLLYSYKTTSEVLLLEEEKNLERNVQLFNRSLNSEARELQRSVAIIADEQQLQEIIFVILNFDSGQDVMPSLYEKLFGWLPVDRTLFMANNGQILLGAEHDDLAVSIKKLHPKTKDRLFTHLSRDGLEFVAVHPIVYRDQLLGSVALTKKINKSWFKQEHGDDVGYIIAEFGGEIVFSSIAGLSGENKFAENNTIIKNNKEFKFYETKIPDGQKGNPKIWYGVNITHVRNTLERYSNKVYLELVVGVFLIIILGWVITRNFDKPLAELRALTNEIAKGGRPKIIKKQAHNEVEQLRNQFSDMIYALSEKEEMLSNQRNHLEALVKQRTSALELTRDEALAANVAKSQFMANMSHELRTPLNIIIGYSEIVLEEISENGSTSDEFGVSKIRESGSHLLAIISDILDLSVIESGKLSLQPEKFSVADLIDDVISSVEILAKDNDNKLSSILDKSITSMYSDKTKVKQALFNLLSNANKFTNKGSIELTVKGVVISNEQWVEMKVSDTGIGIARDDIPKLFTPFTQVDMTLTRKYGGTGLGLAITDKYCRYLGGKITVDSELNKGSSFTLLLPTSIKSIRDKVS